MGTKSTNSCWNNNTSEAHGGPLYHMSSLTAALPCKRGLSKFYGGKSQSFSCLEDVTCIDELAKTQDSYYSKKKNKGCHERGLRHSKSYEPRISSASMISKRPQKASKMMIGKKAMSLSMSSELSLSNAQNNP
ncbi:hypothetical protein SUGI_0916620 [Cryptomeria japonica]|uniref:protein OXIDATIVE STRESS 3 n=1 Tax=Cryptomeria japonica TaxID=3369 RepID=UPI0024149465|nr:protein OXIDATIVE STRESS 3 [Cryptomeria japonica]GLJ43967.1 hypothetical protein SUGI_0916620 [Cryptomeria japonica]